MLIFSCHADTGFPNHSLSHHGDSYLGHMDNFVGVYGVMQAYFSGQITNNHTRIELTYGEETDMEGAQQVADTLSDKDVVIIVDVTATPTQNDLVIEKCKHPAMQQYLNEALSGLRFDLYPNCPDPVSCFDETDVYSEVTPYCCFLGIPCEGGDYNESQVYCKKQSVKNISSGSLQIKQLFPRFLPYKFTANLNKKNTPDFSFTSLKIQEPFPLELFAYKLQKTAKKP